MAVGGATGLVADMRPSSDLFRGAVFSTTFRDAVDAPRLLAANLLGATLGGFCEYLGMTIGARALLLIVIGADAASLICRLQTKRLHFAKGVTPEIAAGSEQPSI